MIEKRKTCKYCGAEMKSMTAKKQFCSDVHRVYWNRENKQAVIVTDLTKPKTSEFKSPAQPNTTVNTKKEMPEGLSKTETLKWYKNNR